MSLNRRRMYRFPWSRTDNPGGWIEVTDRCDLSCRGCYRHTLTGDAPLQKLKHDVLALREAVNCSSIAIAGGEPLLYPHLQELIEFIAKNGLHSILLTNGEKLSRQMARDLKNAGLSKVQIHIDSLQERPGWTGKNEAELNELRQHYADLIWEVGGIECGFHTTVYRSTLEYIPAVVQWFRNNIHKAYHISLIALRGIPVTDTMKYYAGGKEADIHKMNVCFTDLNEISITSEEIYRIIEKHFPGSHPSAYLNGSSSPESYKYLTIFYLGSKKRIHGTIGPKSIELTQMWRHFVSGGYGGTAASSKVGVGVFALALIDREIRKAFADFLREAWRRPASLFEGLYVQTLHVQQPMELLDGEVNFCDGCANQMLHEGRLINSCSLDQYRIFGGPLIPVQVGKEARTGLGQTVSHKS